MDKKTTLEKKKKERFCEMKSKFKKNLDLEN